MNMVFTTSLIRNSHLQKLINEIKNIVSLLRKTDSTQFIGKTCPSIVETRWLYVYNVQEFIIDNEDEINLILLDNEMQISLNEFNQLFNLILPLRRFVDKMESNVSICSVGKYLKEVLVYMKNEKYDLI